MTCREKFFIDHPHNKLVGCPSDYGYLPVTAQCVGVKCNDCWDQEIPGTEKSECEMDVISALINLCNTVSLNYDKVVSEHLTINEDGVCCINDKPYDDRTELIMSIRLFVTSYVPNVDFRSQVHEYFESKRREAV